MVSLAVTIDTSTENVDRVPMGSGLVYAKIQYNEYLYHKVTLDFTIDDIHSYRDTQFRFPCAKWYGLGDLHSMMNLEKTQYDSNFGYKLTNDKSSYFYESYDGGIHWSDTGSSINTSNSLLVTTGASISGIVLADSDPPYNDYSYGIHPDSYWWNGTSYGTMVRFRCNIRPSSPILILLPASLAAILSPIFNTLPTHLVVYPETYSGGGPNQNGIGIGFCWNNIDYPSKYIPITGIMSCRSPNYISQMNYYSGYITDYGLSMSEFIYNSQRHLVDTVNVRSSINDHSYKLIYSQLYNRKNFRIEDATYYTLGTWVNPCSVSYYDIFYRYVSSTSITDAPTGTISRYSSRWGTDIQCQYRMFYYNDYISDQTNCFFYTPSGFTDPASGGSRVRYEYTPVCSVACLDGSTMPGYMGAFTP